MKPGTRARVCGIRASRSVRTALQDLGLLPGAPVELCGLSDDRSSLRVRIRGHFQDVPIEHGASVLVSTMDEEE
jgi:Fe2+ transport system protein FeoA